MIRHFARNHRIPSSLGHTPKRLNSNFLNETQFHKLSDSYLDSVADYFEGIGEDNAVGKEYDVLLSAGVLTLKLGGERGTYVLNKQPPNKQIWLSSPISGPKRYDWIEVRNNGNWIYSRDGSSLKELLDKELSEALGMKIDTPND